MKTTIINWQRSIALLLGFGVWTACTNEPIDVTTTKSEETQSLAMSFKGSVIPFDAQAATRAGEDEWTWDDGATIYIQYYVGSSIVRGHAVYIKATDSWEASYSGSLAASDKCEVYFFEGASTSDKRSVTLSDSKAIYADKFATYTVANGQITLEAALAPITSRIYFNGTKNVNMSVRGITHYTSYNAETNTLVTSTSDISRTVGTDGATSYIYGIFTDQTKRQLTVTNSIDVVAFSKSFASSVFKVGESGYMTLPTEDTNKGWSFDDSMDPLGLCPDGKHPHQIDMGTGVKFACCNVGASSPIGYGDYYAWGETSTKSNYAWSTYKWCNGSSSTMTKYCDDSSYGTFDSKTQLEISDDAARANWGGTWRMPKQEEWSKLKSNCSWNWTAIRSIKGYKVRASNGNSIFLPASGNHNVESAYSTGSGGYYWSSSLSWGPYAIYLFFSSYSIEPTYRSERYYGYSVRPVTE